MENEDYNLIDGNFINDVKNIIEDARRNAVRSVDHCRVQMYWNIGKRIFEKDLENAIISHITDFLLEMDNGFSFIARQKRILLEDDEFFIDLVFYNRLLRSFVIVELKTEKLTHQDIGQLQMYVNYYDRCEKLPEENPTIGILLGTSKNDTVVKMTLPEDNKNILANEYRLYLPTKLQLIREIEDVRKTMKNK